MKRQQTERTWHNVKQNETTRVPNRHIFLDTEAVIRRSGKAQSQRWRLAVACYSTTRKDRPTREEWVNHDTQRHLWDTVTEFAGSEGRTVLWAHNLGYDARISSTFTHLPRLGWRLVGHNITPRGTWLEWKRDKATLLMVDSASVFATTIAKVGKYFGIGKLPIPSDDASEESWFAYCRRDTEILHKAVTTYLQWLRDDDMGNWQLTGAGQSWATFRHKFLTHKMVVHDDERALKAERRAMWAGRCEAYWRGELKGQVVHEWDFTEAYVRIARDYSVPVRLLGPMPKDYDWVSVLESEHTSLLATVDIETDAPVVPTSKDGRILWPVGRFTTTIWDVEIKAAIDAGAKVTIREGWLYRSRPALKAWAEWVIENLNADDSVCPTWQKTIFKHWSRALIGRLAMTHQSWEEWAESPSVGVMRATVWDRDAKEEYDIMQVGNTIWRDAGREEWAQSMPMITGFVQAVSRVRLWNVLQALPPRVALYADTDSLLCTDKHLVTVARIADTPTGQGLRLKRSWDGFAIMGPRQVVTGELTRVSGMPHRAKAIGKGRFAGEVWDSLPGALKRGTLDRVIVRDREWNIRGTDHRRHGIGIGWTEPFRVDSLSPAP
jgi:hypothetical protein